MFSQSFIAKVKDAIDLLELVKEHVEVRSVGANVWQSRCPHPEHNDSSPSFRIWKNKEKNGKHSWSWACMGCHQGKKNARFKNYGSDCFAFIQWMSDYAGSKKKFNWREAITILAKRANIALEEEKYSEVYQGLRRVATAYHNNLLPPVKQYLYSRGLDDTDLRDWLIGFDGSCKRITFPLFDRYRQVIGFSNRKIGCTNDLNPKYKNSSNSEWFNKGSYFYGIHLLDNECDEIRVTEGSVDVVVGKKWSVQNLMAPLGTSFTEEHAEIIKNWGKIPCFCMDGDDAGVSAAKRSIEIMASIGVYSKVLFLPAGMDMADLANQLKEDTEAYIQANSMPYWQYALKDAVTQYDAKVNELRMKTLPTVKAAHKSVGTDDERAIMESFVKERFGIAL